MIKKLELDKIINRKLVEILETKIIYQYSSFNTSLDKIILEKTLQFANPEKFNDPFDCNERLLDIDFKNSSVNHHIKELSKKKLSYYKRQEMIRKLKSPETLTEMFNKRKKEFKISCFSKLSDEVLMWSHYADKHSGICVGFDFGFKYQNKFILCPVNYYNKIKNLDGECDTKQVFLYWLTTKSERWKYEEEIRAISNSITTTDYEYINYDKKHIKEIIFGCNVPESMIKEAIEKINRSDININDITFKRMTIDPKTFLLKENILKPNA